MIKKRRGRGARVPRGVGGRAPEKTAFVECARRVCSTNAAPRGTASPPVRVLSLPSFFSCVCPVQGRPIWKNQGPGPHSFSALSRQHKQNLISLTQPPHRTRKLNRSLLQNPPQLLSRAHQHFSGHCCQTRASAVIRHNTPPLVITHQPEGPQAAFQRTLLARQTATLRRIQQGTICNGTPGRPLQGDGFTTLRTMEQGNSHTAQPVSTFLLQRRCLPGRFREEIAAQTAGSTDGRRKKLRQHGRAVYFVRM